MHASEPKVSAGAGALAEEAPQLALISPIEKLPIRYYELILSFLINPEPGHDNSRANLKDIASLTLLSHGAYDLFHGKSKELQAHGVKVINPEDNTSKTVIQYDRVANAGVAFYQAAEALSQERKNRAREASAREVRAWMDAAARAMPSDPYDIAIHQF